MVEGVKWFVYNCVMLIHTITEVREKVKEWRRGGLSVGFVPTMGALHEGHLSLIEASIQRCDKTVVSIFVNPTQFGPNEDFSKYPRTLEEDVNLCKTAGVDLIFVPSVEEIYPCSHIMSPPPSPLSQGEGGQACLSAFPPSCPLTTVIPPYVYTDALCAKLRPGHFDGVCTVVAKLFNIVMPDFAFFGEKDRQQLIIIKKMTADLNMPVKVVPCPIVRDENGLALSSRNKYLDLNQKNDALVLNKILQNIKICYDRGITDLQSLSETAYMFLNDAHSLEYLEFRDKDNLEEKAAADDDTAVFIAVKIGSVRLIDNIALKS